MPASTHPTYLRHLKRRMTYHARVKKLFEQGISINKMTIELGLSENMIKNCLYDLGLKPRTRGEAFSLKHLSNRKPYHAKIKEMFEQEVSVLEMAKRIGRDRVFVTYCLNDLGLTPRSGSEANIIRMKNTSFEERQKITLAANKAARTVPRTIEQRTQRAKLNQRIKPRVGKFEVEVMEYLLSHGFETIPQYAWRQYNIDLFVPSCGVAIEVYYSSARPGSFPSGWKKIMELLSEQVHVCCLHIPKFPESPMYDQLITFLNGGWQEESPSW